MWFSTRKGKRRCLYYPELADFSWYGLLIYLTIWMSFQVKIFILQSAGCYLNGFAWSLHSLVMSSWWIARNVGTRGGKCNTFYCICRCCRRLTTSFKALHWFYFQNCKHEGWPSVKIFENNFFPPNSVSRIL